MLLARSLVSVGSLLLVACLAWIILKGSLVQKFKGLIFTCSLYVAHQADL